MRASAVQLAALVAVSLGGLPARAGSVRGMVALPASFEPATARHQTHWRVEHGALRIAQPLRDPRTTMLVYLEGRGASAVPSQAAVIDIAGYQFDPPVVAIPIGGTVEIKNTGRVTHVVYDQQKVLAPTSIKPGDGKRQRYHAEGEYVLRDEEFPHMRATVKVLNTALSTRPDEKGNFKLDNVPEGRWVAKLWYAGRVLATATVEVGPKGGDIVLKVPEESKPAAAGKR